MVGTSGVNLFISSDMFYLEILVESSGAVKDVKIHHEGKVSNFDVFFYNMITYLNVNNILNFLSD